MCWATSKLKVSYCCAAACSTEPAAGVPDRVDYKSSRACIICFSVRNTQASWCVLTQVWVNCQKQCAQTGLFLCSARRAKCTLNRFLSEILVIWGSIFLTFTDTTPSHRGGRSVSQSWWETLSLLVQGHITVSHRSTLPPCPTWLYVNSKYSLLSDQIFLIKVTPCHWCCLNWAN